VDRSQHIAQLIFKHLSANISADEANELQEWLEEKKNRAWCDKIIEEDTLSESLAWHHPQERLERTERVWDKVKTQISFTAIEQPVRELKKRNWLPYAAAITILLAGVGTYQYINGRKEKPSASPAEAMAKAGTHNDVAPGGNRATLTLADGSKIVLDSAVNGTIAREGASTITKKGDQVMYSLPSPVSRLPSAVLYNTMSTPRGGQYKLTLPDGTQVWLNAESSITYPTAFTGKERRVMVTGEAYFEVTKDKVKRFIVTVYTSPVSRLPSPVSSLPSPEERSGLEIEVLGTHFNVNTYEEEPTKNITLLEGSVRLKTSPVSRLPSPEEPSQGSGGRSSSPVSRLPSPDKSVLTSLILKPGQQGQLTDHGLSLATSPDIEQVMAWKNGVFNFNNLSLPDVMTQLERWYDVDVVYEKEIPRMTFGGKMGRDLNLSQVTKALSVMGVKFRIEGKKLIVTP
jgi:transmembrane sensor